MLADDSVLHHIGTPMPLITHSAEAASVTYRWRMATTILFAVHGTEQLTLCR